MPFAHAAHVAGVRFRDKVRYLEAHSILQRCREQVCKITADAAAFVKYYDVKEQRLQQIQYCYTNWLGDLAQHQYAVQGLETMRLEGLQIVREQLTGGREVLAKIQAAVASADVL